MNQKNGTAVLLAFHFHQKRETVDIFATDWKFCQKLFLVLLCANVSNLPKVKLIILYSLYRSELLNELLRQLRNEAPVQFLPEIEGISTSTRRPLSTGIFSALFAFANWAIAISGGGNRI